MKYIVVKDTYVSGTPVFAGDTFVLNNPQRVEHGSVTVGKPDLANLKLANRVVALADASEEEIELAEKRGAYLEQLFEKQDAEREAAASKPAKKTKKSAA